MADKIWQVVLTWKSVDQYFQNVLHYRVTEGGSFTDIQYANDIADAFEAGPLSAFLDCLSSTTELRSARIKRVSTPGSPTRIRVYAAGTNPGTRSAHINDTSIGVVLEFPVNLHAKNVTGKVFLGGIADADIVDNAPVGALVTVIDTLATQLLAPMALTVTGTTAKYTIYNRTFQVDTIPASHSIGTHLSSQRRRLVPVLF